MGKILLMSIVAATIVIPVACARDRVAHRGLKRMLLGFVLFTVLYLELLLHAYVPLNLERVNDAFTEAGFPVKISP